MFSKSDLLNVLYGDYKGTLPFELNDDLLEIDDPATIPIGARALPSNEDGLFFVTGFIADAAPDTIEQCKLIPSAVLRHTARNSLILIWALPDPDQSATETLPDLFDMDLNAGVPMPGDDGWAITHCAGSTYAASELIQKYSAQSNVNEAEESQASVTASPELDDVPRYFDARIVTPFSAEQYQEPIKVAIGRHKADKDWLPVEMTTEKLLGTLCRHEEGDKDGIGVVFGDMVRGQRLKLAVKTVAAIGLDIDNGTPIAEIDAAVARLGCLAVRYSTHSYMGTRSRFKKSEITNFLGEEREIDDEGLREYLAQKKHWHESVLPTVAYHGTVHETNGIMISIKHTPISKNRVVIFLAKPYEIANEGKTQLEATSKWARVVAAMGALLGIPFDPACTDPSRLFFLPRHGRNRPHDSSVFGGPLFDRSKLDLDDPFERLGDFARSKGGKSRTDEGKHLGKWFKKYGGGFQLADVINEFVPDKIRGPASMGYNIECPFDDGHSNAGDPSDRACYAVNAADGGNEFFICKCQHGSCQGYTGLDYIAKMIQGKWFPESVLTEERFNILKLSDDDTKGAATNSAHVVDFCAIKKQIDELGEDADPKVVAELLEKIRSQTDQITKARLEQTFKKRTKIPIDDIRTETRQAKVDNEPEYDEKGRLIYYYFGRPDEVQLTDLAYTHMRNWNDASAKLRRVKAPRITCVFDQPCSMRETEGRARFVPLTSSAFRSMTQKLLIMHKLNEFGVPGPAHFIDTDLSSIIYHALYEYVPATPDLISSPIVAADGSILDKSGWHFKEDKNDRKLNMNVYLDSGDLKLRPVSASPSAAEIEAAKACIYELLGEFHFSDGPSNEPNVAQPSFANAVGMLLTPFMRRYIGACTPLFLIEKPAAGAGATLLSELPQIVFGKKVSGATPYATEEAELQKILTAMILEQRWCVVFDNVTDLNNRPLKAALTSVEIEGRILGQSTLVRRPNTFLWIATGINPDLGQEMARRVCRIRLDTKVEDVQTLTYAKSDLKQWALDNRSDLIWSLLTLARNWIAKGTTPFKKTSLKSFESWAEIVGGVLECAGIEGFLDNPRKVSLQNHDHALRYFAKELFDWMLLREKRFPEILNQALLSGYELVTGRDDGAKAACLRGLLNELDARTFNFGYPVSLHIEEENGDVIYVFRKQ